MKGRKRQQPDTARFINTSQILDIHCRSYIIFNQGTDTVFIDNFPVLPGMTFSEGATEDGEISYRMNIKFEFGAGKTQAIYIRQLNDIE